MESFDFIIVGGGSAGCVLADKLSANGQFQVCLLEAGPKNNHWMIKIPLGIVGLMRYKKFNWRFNSAPEATQNDRSIYHPRGKTLGGSSSINAMLYIRGQREDYDHWAELGNKGWSYDEVLPYFKAVENQERGADEFHGTGGPLNVADPRSQIPVFSDFVTATKRAGFPENNDFNGAQQEGVGPYQVTQKDGLRCSAADAFLTPNMGRSNLTVLTDVLVEKVVCNDDKQATGVIIKQNGKRQKLKAQREVIVSAGALSSPQVLMLSGIGDSDELAQHNIELIHELPGVGKNLQEHVDVSVVKQYHKTKILAFRPMVLLDGIKQLFSFVAKRRGVLTTTTTETGAFLKTRPELSRPDIQLHYSACALDDHGRNNRMLMNYGLSIHACLLRPKSTGSIGLYNDNPASQPKIQVGALAEPEDQQVMIDAVKLVRNIFAQEPLQSDTSHEFFPGEQVQSDEQILEFVRNKANTIYHPVGTCKMGHDKMAVVDDQLKVHGMKGLRVVDASIMPTLVSGNTNAPTIMVACKAAEMILADHA